MTGLNVSPQTLIWILCAVWSITTQEDINCPKGAQIHLSSLRCFWLSEKSSSWSEAQVLCRKVQGGDVGNVNSVELQTFIHHSFPVKNIEWIWIKCSESGVTPNWWDRGGGSEGVCAQLALGTLGQTRKAGCDGRYRFICEMQTTESLPSPDSYLTGLVLMSSVCAQTQIQILPKPPDVEQRTVEMLLFPGLWFSHAGQLASVELVVQPSVESTLARIQILRPYCNPNHHLVPPGCSSLLNPFSCCSAVPLCNTTGGCSVGLYWCHLLEACVPTTSPCSPYHSAAEARGFTLPPRYRAVPPFYHLAADLPLKINPTSERTSLSLLLPSKPIMVYPDDIVAIQQTRLSGMFLHCRNREASLDSPWRQSYLSLRGPEWGGWLEGGLTSLPHRGEWVDGVVCDLKMVYVDTLHRGTELGEVFGFTEMTTASDIGTLTTSPNINLGSKFGLTVIQPVPDENNQIHVEINVPILVVVKVRFGDKARSSWSGPVVQTDIPFLPFCPKEIAHTSYDCADSQEAWFSSVTLVLTSVGVQTLNINVVGLMVFESLNVKVWGYEAVTGLNVEPHGCLRVIVDRAQTFTAKVETGTLVKFTWMINDLESFAHKEETYSVVLKKPAQYRLKLSASNPVSSLTRSLLLVADEVVPLTQPEFLFVNGVIAVNSTQLYTLKVKVDVSLPVTFRWDFGDSSGNVLHSHSAPCETEEGLVESGDKQMFVEDSVSYTFNTPDDFTLTVQVFNPYSATDISKMISVRQMLHRILVSFSPLVPIVHQSFLLEASTEPFSKNIVYTWDFGDSSSAIQVGKVNHVFGSAGVYNVTVCANNTISAVTTWLLVEVVEKITGLTISYNGPTEIKTLTEIKAKVTSGTNLYWKFDFGDGTKQENITDGSISHIYKTPGNYNVGVTVSNSVSEVYQSIIVEVYKLDISGILPTECIMAGKNIQFNALVNGNISSLTFHWTFGDGSLLAVVTGNSTTMHVFKNQGLFLLNLTVVSSVSAVPFRASVCVKSPITDVAVKATKDVVAFGEEVCFRVFVIPDFTNGLQFRWSQNSVSTTSITESNEKCFVFNKEGTEEVIVFASNGVSNKTAKVSIAVQKPVDTFSVEHGSPSSTLVVNSKIQFWVTHCNGTNVSIVWDFGDGSPIETSENVSHVFTSSGQFRVKATVFNSVSSESASIRVDVIPPVSDLSINTNQLHVATGDETLFTAVSSSMSSTNYYWTVDGLSSTKQGTYQFRFTFPKPGIYQVKVLAQNLVSRREATITVEALEIIEDLKIGCASLIDMKYIPTHEEAQFTASISKGSNVTYHWLALQNGEKLEISTEGDILHSLVEKTGQILVQLRAVNKLGEAASNVSIVAVERVKTTNMEQKHIVLLGKLVNISVSVVAGSDLHYFWYLNYSRFQTQVPFLLHNFTSLGLVSVVVSVQNVLSQSNVSKLFEVQEEVQEVGLKIERKRQPFYVATNASVGLSGHVRKGSNLHWDWTIEGPSSTHVNATNQTFMYSFHEAGIYNVSLNVSNGINWQMVFHKVIVQDGIEGLLLNVSKSTFCTQEQVTFVPTISQGSNVNFVIIFANNDVTHSYDFVEDFTTSSLPAGHYLVTVKARNQVSEADVSSGIIVAERVQGLYLLNCCSAALEALKALKFTANVANTFPVYYTWIFKMDGHGHTRLLGQEVVFTATESGLLSVTVVASNGVCSETLTKDLTVDLPVKKVKLSCNSETVFLDYVVTFNAKANGSNLEYRWDFGDFSEPLLTDSSKVNHTYHVAGKYIVRVKVFNSVSQVSTQLIVEAEKLQCSCPQVSLVQSQTTIYKSRPSFYEATVHNNCSAYKTSYLWEIFDSTNFNVTGKRVKLRINEVDLTSPFLQLPKHSLQVGQYCLVFTVSLKGTPLHVQQNVSITVVHSPLVAVIKGGSYRMWPSTRDLILDGSKSQDPDMEPEMENELQYNWTFNTVNSTDSHVMNQLSGRSSSNMTVLGTQLHPGTIYVFTLTVHKEGREPVSVNQTVMVSEFAVLPLTVDCTSCSFQTSSHHISYTRPILLSGQCETCTDQTEYKWSAKDQSGQALDLNKVSKAGRSPNLVVRSGALNPGQSYTFTLGVSDPDTGQWGSSSWTVQPNRPPHGGVCVLSPEADILSLETMVTYNCSGWEDNDNEASQLIYTFQVVPCTPVSVSCPVLTLYRGIRSTFGAVVPIGTQGPEKRISFITILVLVEDRLGANVTALNRTLEVKNPNEDVREWLKNKSQTELWAMVQHGNPQEIIPYSIALSSHFNQIEPQNIHEVQDRKEMRQNVTQALASLSISSLNDAAQISSALVQSTAVPSELLSERCQEKVLEAVGKMIHVIDMRSEDVLSAVQTGTNILRLIGNTLAAVSESVSAPGFYQSSTWASALSLSALGQARALMHSLMQLHAQWDAPLSISTPFISTIGFHGDPSDLLCTGESNQSSNVSGWCQFHIPASLTDRLKSQSSELVQVMFGVSDALESNPLLTEADPPISTDVVAMEISTPQGQPIPIRDLDPGQAIRVTLLNKYHFGETGDEKDKNLTCLTVNLPDKEGQLNFTVKDLEELDSNAGLYMAFNFSLVPGVTDMSLGHVTIEVQAKSPEANASSNSLVREWPISLSAPATFSEKTLFLSPLLNGTDRSLSVTLTSSLVRGSPLRVAVCVFSSLCRFYNEAEQRWCSEGVRPLEGTTLHRAHCLTQHLTMFGASLFVHPGAVVLLPPSGGPVRNMVVGIVCAVLVLLQLLIALIAHKLDYMDSLRQSQVPLCGRPGLYHYRVLVKTGRRQGAGTTAHVGISLYGVTKSGSRHLQREGAFQRGSLDLFHLETDDNLGEVWKIRLWHDNTGLDPSWYVQHVVVWDPQTDNMFFFLVEDWLSVENPKNGSVEKEVLASCPDELSRFRRVFTSQLVFGMVERHLWLSLWERPAHSRFTRGQRVTCTALTLHLYLALGAAWYGAVGSKDSGGPVSDHLLVNMETVAVGMTVAVLVYPLQCLLCYLFGKTFSPVTVDVSVPPSPVCHSVEMDVNLDQSNLSSPSFLSLSDSSCPVRESPSSLLESRVFDSSILDFWAASGLVPQSERDSPNQAPATWPSCDSLLNLPADPDLCRESPVLGPARLLRRKKAMMQLNLMYSSTDSSSRVPLVPPIAPLAKLNPVQAYNNNLTTRLTLSDENLIMSITAAEDTEYPKKNNSDSGRDSPTTASPLSTFRSTSSSRWSVESEVKYLYEEDPESCTALFDGGMHKSPSVLSLDSVASTVLPSPSPDSTRCSSSTRIGVARGSPGWLLPSWALSVVYPVVAVLMVVCMAVMGLYGSFFSRTVLLMWLVSALSAFLTSALLLEPLKVCVQALLCAVLRRPVDPEVEDLLAQETTVVRSFGEQCGNVRPPCGYGLLQAKEEARKVRALRSLMRHCVWQLLFLMLVLMVNYQDSVEQRHGRLLHSAIKRQLHRAPMGVPNLTALRDWSDAEQWIRHTLVPHLHEKPSLHLVGLPWLQYTSFLGPVAGVLLGNSSEETQLQIVQLKMAQWDHRLYKSLSVDFTHYHRESGLWLCVRVLLEMTQTHTVTSVLSIHPLLVPPSSSGPDLQLALPVVLLICALLMLSGELYSMATERVQYVHEWSHCFQLLLALMSLATAVLQLRFLSLATNCVAKLRRQPTYFISFHSAAFFAQRSSECAAILLTLLVLRLLGTLRFVRRWVVIGRVLLKAWRELWALTVLLLLLLLLCSHVANALFSRSVEGFLSVHQASLSVLSILRGHKALHRLCRVHPYLGSLYSLLLVGGSLWVLARVYGAVLIRTYRSEKAGMYRPTIEPQDYEMVEFFIKRLKLWMGLTKAKEFRHRVKFKGMNVPPSRASQNSRPSTVSSTLPSFRSASPPPLSSALSVRSEDLSGSETTSDGPTHLDRLLPCVSALLSHFDRVNQITEDVYRLEVKLEETKIRRRIQRIQNCEKDLERLRDLKPRKPEREAEVRQRKSGFLYPTSRISLPSSISFNHSTLHSYPATIFPRTRSSYSESESFHLSHKDPFGRAKPASENCSRSMSPAGSPGFEPLPRRRAWHSGSSHSADAAQRILQSQGGVSLFGNSRDNLAFVNGRPRSEDGARRRIIDGIPKKRTAWICEGPENEPE